MASEVTDGVLRGKEGKGTWRFSERRNVGHKDGGHVLVTKVDFGF